MYLFFDTETTGIPRNYKAPASDLRNWPRLVQIAWLLAHEQAHEVESAEYIVKPERFTIPKDAARVHAITSEIARQNGAALETVLAAVRPAIEQASVLVAHNMEFEEKMLGAELLRTGYPDIVEAKKRQCTMQAATKYCRLPGQYGYKWPSLQERHMKLFGQPFEGAHDALVDVRACSRCYYELRRLGVMA